MSKKSLTVGIVLLISLGFLVYTFKDVQYAELLEVLSRTEIKYLFLWGAIFLIGTFVRGLRWGYIINEKNLNFLDLFHSLNLGNLASMILPFRAGEFVRPYYLSKWTDVSLARTVVSVVLERVFDVLGMFLIFYIFVKELPTLPAFISIAASGLAIICTVIIFGMLLARFFPDPIRDFFQMMLNFLPNKMALSFTKLFDEVLAGLGSIKSFRQLLMIVITTIVIWFSYALCFALVFFALGSEGTLSLGAITCVFVSLAIAAPNAPGFFLTFEMGTSAALSLFAYQGEFSLAYALVAHSLQLFCTLLVGFFSLWSKGLSLRGLRLNNS